MIVADTNVVAYLLIEGDHTPDARTAWQRDPRWTLPSLWRSEFLNILATSVRHGVLDAAQASRAFRDAVGLFASAERDPPGDAVLATALEYGISAYDAQFLVVAQALQVPLVTCDRRLALACPNVATLLSEFAR